MSFIENLAKGFIRSAVNQVGRDGGKVISNKIYKNKHSTPIRVIGNNNIEETYQHSNNEINSRSDFKNSGYKAELLSSNMLFYFSLVVFGLLIPIVGPLSWVYFSIKNFAKKYTLFYTISQEPVYVKDKRYKTGMRQEGCQSVKVYADTVSIPTNSERIVYILKGFVGLAFALGFIGFQYSVYKGITNSDSASNKNQVVVNIEDGIQLKGDSTETSTVVKVAPVNDTIEILSPKSDSYSNWTRISYNNVEGWVSKETLTKNELVSE